MKPEINKQGQQGKGPTAGWDKGNLNKDKGQTTHKPGEGRPTASGGKQGYDKSQQQGGGGFGQHNIDRDKR